MVEKLDKVGLEQFFNKEITPDYEGYVQISDRKGFFILENGVSTQTEGNYSVVLGSFWNSVHNESGDNFIIEAAFYSKDKNCSILIRQINNYWSVSQFDLGKFSEKTLKEVKFFSKYSKKVKIAQLWSEKIDPFCEGFSVLKPVASVFYGFDGGDK